MAENSSKGTLLRVLSPIDPVSIESPMTGIGIPDLNHKYGWIECKAMKSWPKNADKNPVIFPHTLSKAQQVWLYRRERAGGSALVCGKISTDWFFWSGRKIKEFSLWDQMTKSDMHRWAEISFKGKLPRTQLIDFLREYSLENERKFQGSNQVLKII